MKKISVNTTNPGFLFPLGARQDSTINAPGTNLDGKTVTDLCKALDASTTVSGDAIPKSWIGANTTSSVTGIASLNSSGSLENDINGTSLSSSVTVGGVLSDIGSDNGKPFVVLAMGQSNMVGRDTLGDKTIESGIFCNNEMLNSTEIVSAAYGVSPLNLKAAGAGTTTVVADCCNNQAIAFANALRKSGQLPEDRDIVIIFNCVGGKSITEWVGSGVSSGYWVALLNSLKVLAAKYTSFDINHVIWDQGESDYTGSNTLFSSKDAYLTGFATLYSQLQALPYWTPTTTLSVTELGLWSDNTQQDRNDALRTLGDGAVYPYVTFVSTEGFTQSLQAPPFHYNGIALQEIGLRHFQAWNLGRLYGSYCPFPRNTNGGSRSIPNKLVLDGTSLTVQPSDLLSGICVIDATQGGTITLPPCATIASHNFCTVRILSSTNLITLTSTNSIVLWNNTSSGNGHIPHNSIVDCFVSPDATYWKAVGVSPRLGDIMANYLSLSSATTLPEEQCRGLFLYLGSGTTSLTLPNIMNAGIQSGHSVTVYSSISCPITISSGGTFRYPSSGTSPSTILAEQYTVLKFISVSGTWVVLEDSEENPQYYSYSGTSVILTERQCRNSTVYFSNPNSIVLPDISSSLFQGGYKLTIFVSANCTITQSGSGLFRLCGEGYRQVSSISATPSRGILKFVSINNRWFLLPGSEVSGRQSIYPSTSVSDLSGYQVGDLTVYLNHSQNSITPPTYPADGSTVTIIFSTASSATTWNGLWNTLSLPSSQSQGDIINLRYIASNSIWVTI